jgi:hypothetical protein
VKHAHVSLVVQSIRFVPLLHSPLYLPPLLQVYLYGPTYDSSRVWDNLHWVEHLPEVLPVLCLSSSHVPSLALSASSPPNSFRHPLASPRQLHVSHFEIVMMTKKRLKEPQQQQQQQQQQ